MTTVADLVFEQEFSHLQQVAESRGWELTRIDGPGFILVLPAYDGSTFALRVVCDNYPRLPPVWHWYNPRRLSENAALSDVRP